MMGDVLLEVSGLTKRFGGLVATNDLALAVERGETHAIIGPNGAGKTTLIAQLQGELRSDEGSIRFNGRDIVREPAYRRAGLGIARSFQITSIFPKFSALANVALAVQAQAGHGFRFFRGAASDPALLAPALQAIATVGLSDRAEMEAENLSHGERRQLEIAMALAMRPSLLLLDEPMAGMSRRDGARMTRLLADLKRTYTIVLVEHDMDTVFSLADRISVLVAGRTIATGPPDEIRANADVRAAYLGHRK
jgi:branched-chain amino acid transport system ATP-binding protein